MPAVRVIDAAKAMLPKLRIILAAMIATCAAVLALSAGVLGTRDPANNLSGVPDVSRTLVRQAVVEEPEWRQSQLLAYSRRADELLRLRDLPATPVRAVVEYAEQAQARAGEAARATAAPPADSATPPAAATSERGLVVAATAPTPPADMPPSPAADGAAVLTPSTETPPRATVATAMVATAPAANPPADTSGATVVANAPVAAPPSDSATAVVSPPATSPAAEAPVIAAPADTVAAAAPAAPAASGDTQVANVQTGSETAEMYGPEKPKAKKRHAPKLGPKVAQAHPAKPKKKAQVTRPTRTVAPAASTGFPVDRQNTSPNTVFGSWGSNQSTTR